MAGGLLACRTHVDFGPKPLVKLRQGFRSSSVRLDINSSQLVKMCICTLFLPTRTLQQRCSRFILALRPSVPDSALWTLFFLPDCSQKVSALSSFDYTLVISPPRSMGGSVKRRYVSENHSSPWKHWGLAFW